MDVKRKLRHFRHSNTLAKVSRVYKEYWHLLIVSFLPTLPSFLSLALQTPRRLIFVTRDSSASERKRAPIVFMNLCCIQLLLQVCQPEMYLAPGKNKLQNHTIPIKSLPQKLMVRNHIILLNYHKYRQLFFVNNAYTYDFFPDLLSTVGLNRNSKEEHSLMLEEKLKEASMGGIDKVHHLYGHGVCKWPGCETMCDDLQVFLK